ncbi:uncharacterized protein LOC127743009 [Arachis duranensis]|uniref:Uncharacterized protein LOC127743009 n=1 Tax=Arachis duranensis TaxID=130453 RepID=A0A9C6WJ12_ARADU|nr:uncharacterized protein LOC127743009 [Arachis duranensis]
MAHQDQVIKSWSIPITEDGYRKPMLEMVVMDELGNRIQCSVKNPHRRFFENDITDEKLYSISNFSLAINNQKYKPTTPELHIYFRRETILRRVDDLFFLLVHHYERTNFSLGSANFFNLRSSQELEHVELHDKEEDDGPIFFLIDEWREFFAKAEARRKQEITKRKIVSSCENTSTHEFNDSPPVDQNESSQSIEPEDTLSTDSEVSHVQLDVQRRKSNKYWTVELEDANRMIKEGHLRLKDVWVPSRETKVIVHWNEHGQPIGEFGRLLGLFLGAVAGNFKNFPISYEKWPMVPKEPYKNGAYRDIIHVLFYLII